MQAVGLQTYIWNNNFKSVLLLVLFPALLLLLVFAVLLLIEAYAGGGYTLADSVSGAWRNLPAAAPFAFAGTAAWYGVAYFGHNAMISASTGAHEVERTQAPELYNMLENLCISRGLAMPRLNLIESDMRNAFASGLREDDYTITVTRGLVDALEPDELEAVLAHELTHIRNRDVRLLVIAAIFVGVIAFVGEVVFRSMFRANVPRSGRYRRSGGGNAAVLVLVAFAILAVAYGLAIVLRFALSRRREYLADAGSVELTKNPDAMVRALEKVTGHTAVERAPAEVREMFLAYEPTGFAGLFATHPPVEKRIEALRDYGGALI